MKALKLSLLAAAATIAFAGAAQAADRPLGVTFNVGAATDYVFRGISQTNEDPQVFGGADVTIGGIGYAGVWASNVDFGDDTDMEYDLYAGVKPTVGPVTLDLGLIRYGYHDEGSADWTYYEWKAAGSLAAGPATVGAAVYYSHDFTGSVGPATYYELNGAIPLKETKFTVSGAVGRQTFKDISGDYTTFNIGMGYALTDHIGIDVRYWNNDAGARALGDIYKQRVVAGIKATF